MQRVMLFVSHPLLGMGVESLLRRESGLEIVARDSDAAKLLQHIRELRPDVVIVDSAVTAGQPAPIVLSILEEGPGTRVIGLNDQDNQMCVYTREMLAVNEVKDLVEAIQRPALA